MDCLVALMASATLCNYIHRPLKGIIPKFYLSIQKPIKSIDVLSKGKEIHSSHQFYLQGPAYNEG